MKTHAPSFRRKLLSTLLAGLSLATLPAHADTSSTPVSASPERRPGSGTESVVRLDLSDPAQYQLVRDRLQQSAQFAPRTQDSKGTSQVLQVLEKARQRALSRRAASSRTLALATSPGDSTAPVVRW